MTELTKPQLQGLMKKLTERREDLTKMVKAGAATASRENIARMGGEVGDPGDEAAALQQADLNLTEVENEMREMRAVDRALERIKEGTYGDCADCGCEVPYARLEAYPTAERCTACQTRHERAYGAHDITPSL